MWKWFKISGSILSFLLIGVPTVFSVWWYMFFNVPPYVWFKDHRFPAMITNHLWLWLLVVPISIGLALLFLIWRSLWPARTRVFQSQQKSDAGLVGKIGHAPQPAPAVQLPAQHDLSYLADPAYDRFWPESWRDSLTKKGQGLMEQWTTRLDYPEKQRRETESVNWLSEVNEFARKHLKVEQLDQFMRNYRNAMAPAKKYEFAMALMNAGSGGGTQDHDLAFEIACKVKLLERFRSELTQQPVGVLEEQIESRIRVSCGKAVDKSVVRADGETWYRARLDLNGTTPVPDIEARVTELWEGETKVPLQEVLTLTMYPGVLKPEGDFRTLNEGCPEFVDIIRVGDGIAHFPLKFYPRAVDHKNLLKSNHTYRITVMIYSRSNRADRCTFEFQWTGDPNTSDIRLISVTPPS